MGPPFRAPRYGHVRLDGECAFAVCQTRRVSQQAAAGHLVQVTPISSQPYTRLVAWEIKATVQVKSWQESLNEEERLSFIAALELLREGGPTQGRPIVERIHSSKHQNMKELRPRGAGRDLRILFMFDPLRQAILLFGGSKAQQWNDWYRSAIPEAERLYEQYLADLRSQGELPDP